MLQTKFCPFWSKIYIQSTPLNRDTFVFGSLSRLTEKSRNDICSYYLQFSVVDPLWRFSQLPLSKHKTNSRLSGDFVPINRKFVKIEKK